MTRAQFDAAIQQYASFSIPQLQHVLGPKRSKRRTKAASISSEGRPLSVLEKIIIKRLNVPVQEARDIVVKGIAELYKKEKYKEFKGKSQVLTWLVGCLRNTVRQWRREQAKLRERTLPIEGLSPQKNEHCFTGQSGELVPFGGDKELTWTIIERSLEKLPTDVQSILRRVYLDRAPWAEVAAELKVEVRSLQRRVGRYLAPFRAKRGSRGKAQRPAGTAPEDIHGYMALAGFIAIDQSPPERAEVPFSPQTMGQIRSWIRDGDIDKLLQGLERDAAAIAHPVVRLYTRLLRDLTRGLPLGLNPVPPSLTPYLPSTSRAALKTLTRLGEAWVRGLFPAGWSVKITPPKGAPRGTSKFDEWLLLGRFNTICGEIDQHPDTPLLFAVQTTAGGPLVGRLASLVQKVGQQSSRRDATGRLRITPMPMKKAREIARRAVRRNKASQRLLALSLLAHETGKTLRAVESLISRAEATFPKFDRRRLSRQPS